MVRRGLAGGAVLLLALAGCSGADQGGGVASAGGGPSAPPATSAPVSEEERGRQFAKCMRDNGVDMPDPEPGDGPGSGGGKIDRSSPAFEKAVEACKSLLPGGGDLSKLDPQMVDQLRQFTQCMRDNGVDVPDPDPNSPTLGLGALAGLDRDDPVVRKALEACQDKIPQRGNR